MVQSSLGSIYYLGSGAVVVASLCEFFCERRGEKSMSRLDVNGELSFSCWRRGIFT